MAFLQKNFGLIGDPGNSDVPRHWSYKTDDTHATVDTVSYFDTVSGLVRVGDWITVVVVTNLNLSNEAVSTYGHHIVNAVSAAGVVDVSDVTVLIVADAD